MPDISRYGANIRPCEHREAIQFDLSTCICAGLLHFVRKGGKKRGGAKCPIHRYRFEKNGVCLFGGASLGIYVFSHVS